MVGDYAGLLRGGDRERSEKQDECSHGDSIAGKRAEGGARSTRRNQTQEKPRRLSDLLMRRNLG
jgi:hypothetical protein